MESKIIEVIKAFFDKISNVLGWLDDPHGIKPMLDNNFGIVLNQVAIDSELPFSNKFLFLSQAIDARKAKNMTDIIIRALPLLEDNANPKDLDDDWIMDYFDMASKIQSEDMKNIWARILAEETNCPNNISKRLLHNMFLMSRNDADNFLNLSRFCFYDRNSNNIYPIIFIKGYEDTYSKYGLTTEALKELENLFFIELNYDSGFAFKKEMLLMYTNHLITLCPREENNKIHIGYVRLTTDGRALFNIIEKQNNDIIFDFTLQELRKLCIVNINIS